MAKSVRAVQSLLTEFVGTLFLVLVIVLSGARGGNKTAYIPIGVVVASLIYSADHISGAQFNPAVTLGLVVSRRMRLLPGLLYMLVQTLGGMTGALLAYAIASPSNVQPFTPSASGPGPAFAVEALYTFALVLVQQNAAAEKNAREPNSYFGIAVAFTVLAGACAVGPISGGCFNPAVGTGLDFASLLTDGSSGMRNVWLYWSAPCVGALAAAGVQAYQNLRSHLDAEGLPSVVPVTEAIGTFFIVLTAALTKEGLAVGAMVLAMVYAADHVCGADFNPAVTLGVALRMGVPPAEYWKVGVTMAAQFLGALAAAFTAYGVQGSIGLPNGGVDSIHGLAGAVVFEALWTGLLVFVVCSVMTPTHGDDDPALQAERAGHSRSYQGLAIGFVVAGGIYCAGPLGGGSGGVFNPALGSAIVATQAAFPSDSAPGVTSQLWVYWAGPFAGSLLGAGLFSLLHHHADPVLEYSPAGGADVEPEPSFF